MRHRKKGSNSCAGARRQSDGSKTPCRGGEGLTKQGRTPDRDKPILGNDKRTSRVARYGKSASSCSLAGDRASFTKPSSPPTASPVSSREKNSATSRQRSRGSSPSTQTLSGRGCL